MGFISLWIILYHTGMSLPSVLGSVKTQGFGGTDVFLFLSGFGLYYSLKKNDDIMPFYKRRIRRVMPAYIPFLLASYASLIFAHLSELKTAPMSVFQTFCGNLSMLGRIAGLDHQTNAYIPLILWLYLFTPILFHLITDFSGKKRAVRIALLFTFMVLINITFWGNTNAMKCLSRIFTFALGIIFADMKERKISGAVSTVLAAAAFAAGIALIVINQKFFGSFLTSFGFEYYPYILIAPSLSILIGRFFSLLDRISVGKAVNSFFAFLGRYSFGIYLVHSLFFLVAEALFKNRLNNILWLVLSAAAVVMGIVYQYVIELIVNRLLPAEKTVRS